MLGQEVNIVDHQNISRSEVMPEILHSTSLHTLMEEIHKRGTRDVADVCVGLISQNQLTDRLQKVGLPKPNTTVDEIRVVGSSGLFRDGRCRHQGEAISGSDDEIFKDIIRTQNHLLGREINSLVARNSFLTAVLVGRLTWFGLLTLFWCDETH